MLEITCSCRYSDGSTCGTHCLDWVIPRARFNFSDCADHSAQPGNEYQSRPGGWATSNLDPRHNNKAVQEIMQEEFAGYTIITAAHRQETIQNVNFTVEMNAGLMTNISVPQPAPTLFNSWVGWVASWAPPNP